MSDEVSTPVDTAPESPVTEAVDESQPVGEDEGQEKAPKKVAPKYRKIKIGDEEISLSDDDIVRDYKKWRGADEKFREASAARTATEKFLEQLAADPEKVLSDKRLPFDKQKLAEKWLMESIQAELNPPDPRDEKLSETERRLKDYEDRERAQHEQEQQTEAQQFVEERKTAIGNTLQKAMESSQLSKDPESAAATLREMALYLRAARERGENPDPEEIAEHVHNSRFKQFYGLAQQFEGEDLIEFLGEEVVKRIRKADLARLRGPKEPTKQHRNESWQPSEKPSKRLDSYEMAERARKYLGGK